ncbi:MAG: phosphatase PAP2 family protein [Melioribacteraceae bacterium]|nr:MAG: phosphatase PAP2 family protein [Melioribacteraceae bacterium]
MKNLTPKFFFFYLLILIFILSAFESKLLAQNQYNFRQFINEGSDLIKQPAKWNLGEWLTFGGLAAGSYAIMHFDENIRAEILIDRSYNESIPIVFGRIYGEPYTSSGLGLFFLIHGVTSNNKANEKLGFEILQSFIYTGMITQIAKVSFGRTRPYLADNAFEFNPFPPLNDSFLSFFSGHTSVAFSLSTIIAGNVNGTGWKFLSYVPAVLTGFSRIYQNKHWTSDVFMGAAVGYFIGRFVINTHEEKEKYIGHNLIQPQPLINISLPIK